MYKIISYIIVVVALILPLSSLAIGDINAGKTKALVCAGCHGLNGIAIAPNFPNLASQKRLYLINAITSYRDGIRHDPTMKAMTIALNDDDIANLAAYFSSLPMKQ